MVRLLRKLIGKLRGEPGWDHLVARGLQLGRNVHIGAGAFIDPDHCWLISIADEVTIAPGVTILAHDASTKKQLGYTRIALVRIERGAFIGAGSIILAGVNVGENAIIGAGSVVTRDVARNSVVAGNPAMPLLDTPAFIEKHRQRMQTAKLYPAQGWTVDHGITADNKQIMRRDLQNGPAYIE